MLELNSEQVVIVDGVKHSNQLDSFVSTNSLSFKRVDGLESIEIRSSSVK